MGALRSQDIPNATIPSTRSAVQAVRDGARTSGAVAGAIARPGNHGSYALHAGRVLGWLHLGGVGWEVTEAGRVLLERAPDTDAERAWVHASGAGSPVLARLAPDLLLGAGPTRGELAARIRQHASLSESSAMRRASVLRGWREYARARSQLALALPEPELPVDWQRALHRMNPWWTGNAADAPPPVRRPFTRTVRRRLESGLTRIVAVRGPRRVGKSTAQRQLVEDLLREGVDRRRILRVQCDDLASLHRVSEPILRTVEWYERTVLGQSINAVARDGGRVWLLLDEVQDLADWSVQLKHLVDHVDVAVHVTGSSALRIEEGRDSLAGRLSMVEVGPMSLQEIAAVSGLGALRVVLPDNGVDRLALRETWEEAGAIGRAQRELRDRSFELLSERGGLPDRPPPRRRLGGSRW
jgi:hypothetical protein